MDFQEKTQWALLIDIGKTVLEEEKNYMDKSIKLQVSCTNSQHLLSTYCTSGTSEYLTCVMM